MNSFFLSLGGTGMDLVGDLEVIFFFPFFFFLSRDTRWVSSVREYEIVRSWQRSHVRVY